MREIVLLFVIIISIASCALERSNPLDPVDNDVTAPDKVIGISVSKTSSDDVIITWMPKDKADGYYVYRSLSPTGKFQRIDNGSLNASQYDSFIDDNTVPDRWYYYKMSAYVIVGNDKLEGWRSNPQTW